MSRAAVSRSAVSLSAKCRRVRAACFSTAASSHHFNRRFARSSRLLFQTYVYNAARTAAARTGASVQVFRDDQGRHSAYQKVLTQVWRTLRASPTG